MLSNKFNTSASLHINSAKCCNNGTLVEMIIPYECAKFSATSNSIFLYNY